MPSETVAFGNGVFRQIVDALAASAVIALSIWAAVR
jgi:hypothetical protein